jgi:glycerol-3-phosphate acyltransferase PlsY
MTHILVTFAFMLGAFLWGGIPVGYIGVKRLKGIDIRSYGSGNIGATNVRRVLGNGGFFAVLALDAVKGALPVLALGLSPGLDGPERILIAASTIAGNLFSPWLGLKGGKGISTSLGALLALAPVPVLASTLVFAATLLVLNYMSIACLAGSIVLPIAIFTAESIRGIRHDTALLLFSVVLASALAVTERANIARVRRGTEPGFFAHRACRSPGFTSHQDHRCP